MCSECQWVTSGQYQHKFLVCTACDVARVPSVTVLLCHSCWRENAHGINTWPGADHKKPVCPRPRGWLGQTEWSRWLLDPEFYTCFVCRLAWPNACTIPFHCKRSVYTRRGFSCNISVGQALWTCLQSDWVIFHPSLRHRMVTLWFFCPAKHKSWVWCWKRRGQKGSWQLCCAGRTNGETALYP